MAGPVDPRTPGTAGPDAARSRGQALGRGLEDISHLFLSPRFARGNGPDRREGNGPLAREGNGAAAPDPPQPGAAPPRVPLLLRPGRAVGVDLLAASVKRHLDTLESGLTVLDTHVPCGPGQPADLLAIDRGNQVTVVDLDEHLDANLLFRGLGHCAWLAANMPMVQRMYQGPSINTSLPPRLILMAFRTPPAAAAISQIAAPYVDCFRCRVLELNGETAILCERAWD